MSKEKNTKYKNISLTYSSEDRPVSLVDPCEVKEHCFASQEAASIWLYVP